MNILVEADNLGSLLDNDKAVDRYYIFIKRATGL